MSGDQPQGTREPTAADKLAQAEKVIANLQKLVVNVRGWVSRGQSETAIRHLDFAQEDGWAETGWRDYCAMSRQKEML